MHINPLEKQNENKPIDSSKFFYNINNRENKNELNINSFSNNSSKNITRNNNISTHFFCYF